MELSGNNEPLVSVVIVNWNGLEDTKLCLEHTKKQTYQNLEIIVVDNGSKDGSADYLRNCNDIIIVENPKNLGFTGGHIAGFEASSGDFILLLNNDAIMDPQYIERAVSFMNSDSSIGALGGRAYLWDEDNKLFDTTNSFYSYQNINPINAEGIFAKTDEGVPQEVNNVSGSCVMVRRATIESTGYLHNPFFAYFEESDLFARMKRKGYKIVYHPELAIWHANAKSSNRKAPTFFYYMIMRNRFRFAVRNFDRWSLLRFLKFYLIMGLVSILKSCLPVAQRPMHQAYAKAFLYNLLFGWRAFRERLGLIKQLGVSDYNSIIVREQTGLSVVLTCNNTRHIPAIVDLCKRLNPLDELLLVTSSSAVERAVIAERRSLPHTFRLCVDRGYFKTHQHNIGAVCAKNKWVLLSVPDSINSVKSAYDHFSKGVYFITRSGKKMACFTKKDRQIRNFKSSLSAEVAQEILINTQIFIDEGGLDKKYSLSNAVRQVLAYSVLAKTIYQINTEGVKAALPPFSGLVDASTLHKQLSAQLHQAKREHKKPTFIDRFADRYYRFAQLRNLTVWFFYWRIPFRLKLGRLKSLVLATLKLSTSELAIVLKHMRNEVVMYKNAVDVVGLKMKEQERLSHLVNHPEDTTIFIILRDRIESLKILLSWLKKQNLNKVVFIDNDSKLPPLVDFLETTKFQVLELRRNMTQTAPWSAGVIKVLLPDDFYVVTDPDIIPTSNEKAVLAKLYEVHSKYPHHLKVGFGLKIDDLPDHYPLKEQVIKWESQFWKNVLAEGVYEAGVDTTFAVYKPYSYKYVLNPSIRTGEPYTARHLPWYTKGDKLSDEEIFYRLRADQGVNSWNKEHLPERYKRELEKQGH